MTKQTVRDIDVTGKRVLVRVDYNVPVKGGEVGDTLRIKASFETLRYLLNHNCRIVLLSHLGEPKGAPDPALSLKPVAVKAAELLGCPITFYDDCIGDEIVTASQALKPGEIMMGENVRFHQEELDCDPKFTAELAKLGEVYVNDSFAVDHRRQSSVSEIPKLIPGVAGFLVEKEVDTITNALEHPKRPLVAVIGGAKVSSKIEVLDHLLQKVNALMIGGAMANTFLAADGQVMGKSIYEPELLDTARKVKQAALDRKIDLILPSDLIISSSLDKAQDLRSVPPAHVTPSDYIVDLGHQFADQLARELSGGGTVIWNGPVGLTEVPEFAAGSRAVAEAIIASGAQSIIGGGDTAAFIDAAGLHDKFTWVSTGGGASLDLIAGKELPGVAALRNK